MDIKKIFKLAEEFEEQLQSSHSVSQGLHKLMEMAPEELVRNPKAKHLLNSEIEHLLNSPSKSPKLHNLIRLLKSTVSMLNWAERARNNKQKREELGALEAAQSVLREIGKIYFGDWE